MEKQPDFLDEDGTPLNSKLPYSVVKNVGELFTKHFFFNQN